MFSGNIVVSRNQVLARRRVASPRGGIGWAGTDVFGRQVNASYFAQALTL